MLAWAGLVGGVLIASPQYHLAQTVKEDPVEMTWEELVENGLTDNTHVRLVNVAVEQADPTTFLEEMVEFDPEAPVEEQQAAFAAMAENLDFEQVVDTMFQPLKVYPAGGNPDDYPAAIVIPISDWATEQALNEIEESGTLTGRFCLGKDADLYGQMAKLMVTAAAANAEAEIAAAKQAEADAFGDLGISGLAALQESSEQTPDAADVATEDSEANQQVNAADANTKATDSDVMLAENAASHEQTEGEPVAAEPDQQYVFEPIGYIPPVNEAQQWFWLSGMAVAIGLVICGAGGPSIPCCIFFQVPSILSLFGFPLRYGRGNKVSRLVYGVAGVMMIGYGYDLMVTKGSFGQVDGSIVYASLGFAPLFVGVAAVFGATTNLVASRLNICLDPSEKNPKKYEPKISMTEACSLEPLEVDFAEEFTDRYLMEATEPLSQELESVASALSSVGFEEPVAMSCQDGFDNLPVLIQLGCQDMVVADVEWINGQLQSRLVSILHDGLAIITLSSNIDVEQESRLGTNGQYLRSNHDDPIEMFSAHLEQTIAMAEKRDTAVVTIDPSESIDATAYGRRVLADIRNQYGEEHAEIGSARYGRFAYPPKPVPNYADA